MTAPYFLFLLLVFVGHVAAQCGNGIVDGGEQCDLGAANGLATSCCTVDCTFQPASRQCRQSLGPCDVAEQCTGAQATCPPDQYRSSSTACRPAVGPCDKAEYCTGLSVTCPVNAFMNSSTVCRPSDGDCDVAETCTGVSAACPANVFMPNTEMCRPQQGLCDQPEYCTGAAPACPADALVAANTVCRPSLGNCDAVERCDGVSYDCPVDAYHPNTTECRASAGDCDVPEFCTGISVNCPLNVYVPSTQECRAKNGECDVAENCTGVGPACPADNFLPSFTVCEPAVGECDLPSFCLGSSGTCPPKQYRRNGDVCRPSLGDCDVEETCLGDGQPNCPADVRLNSSFVCRPAKSVCDQPEVCLGGIDCPQDDFSAASTVCRPATDSCDVEETCTGDNPFCPPNLLHTSDSVCQPIDPLQLQCTFESFCTGLSDECPMNKVRDGVSCSVDGNLCFLDTCVDGTCVRGPALNYDDGFVCNGVESCDSNTGLIVAGVPLVCNDGDSCTYDKCDELSAGCQYVPKPDTSGSCFFGAGGCLAGSYLCDGSGPEPVVTCVGAVLPSPEVCGDGIDNNCDFQVDEYCSLHGCSVDSDCDDIDIGSCDIISCQSLVCTVEKKPEGTACEYFRNGQYNGICNDVGLCEATPIECDDYNNCTEDSFSTATRSCFFDPVPLIGTPCIPDNPQDIVGVCTEQGTCRSVITLSCPIEDPRDCFVSIYNDSLAACEEVNRQGSCDDENLCTRHDVCVDGTCSGAVLNCDDGISCTADSCQAGTGECIHVLPVGFCYIDGKCYADGDVNEYCACSVCNSSASQIEWTFTDMASPCDDSDPCTHSDTCNLYTRSCVGLPLDCSSFDSACTLGVCRLGRCEVVAVNEDLACNDGDDCTTRDRCQSGICAGDDFLPRLNSDQCNVASCAGGTVELTPVDDYFACSVEADVCLGQYYCLNGTCVNGGPLFCPPSSHVCTENVCQTEHGCVEMPRPGFACNDSNVCTIGDTCGANGACVPGAMTLNCDDQDPCTDDFCLPDTGCVHLPIANCTTCSFTEDCSLQLCHQAFCISGTCHYFAQQTGTSCSDADVCNGREVCAGNGVCVSEQTLNCDDGNPCTDDSCDSVLGCIHVVNTLNSCSDDNPCTLGDSCQSDGICLGSSSVCPQSTRCAEYSCAVIDSTPVCLKHAKNVDSWCDIDDACMHSAVCTEHGECVGVPVECSQPPECVASYSCSAGVCTPVYESIGTPCQMENLCVESLCDGAGACVQTQQLVFCNDTLPCRVDGVCVPQTGACVYELAPDESMCDDEDACTTVDRCKYGECIGREPVVCQNLDQCHGQGVCDSNTGVCSNPWLPNFTPCVDDSPCSAASVCIFGNCISNEIRECPSSDNQCLTPRCDPNQGCLYDFRLGDCDDNNMCTEDDTCLSGTCSGTPVNCSQQQICGLSYCSPSAGCLPATHDYCDVCVSDEDCPYFPCKSASCQSGVCQYTEHDEAVNGCNDGVFCNGQEYCFAGTCMLAPAQNCDDGNPCTYDECMNDMCVHTPTPNVTCQNDDLCALNAQCDGEGHCLTIVALNCENVNDCVKSTGCNSATGFCEYIVSEDGTPCVDDDLCSVESECRAGICNAVKKRDCASDYSCETSGVCDGLSGRCMEPSTCDVRSCDDGVSCTLDDRCAAGECLSGIYSTCAPAPQCQVTVCHENGTCTLDNVADQTPCDTGVPRGVCSGSDVCISGTCTRTYAAGVLCRPEARGGCDVADVCIDTYDHCPEDVHRPNNISCPSSLYCFDSQCYDGVCVPSVPRDCSQFDGDCSLGVCDESARACMGRNRPDDISCVSGEENQCTPFSRCLSGVCTPYYANELTICNDGDLCTRDSFCSGYDGTCGTGTPVDCTYLDSSCGTGFCDGLTGTCQPQSLNEGQPCNADSDTCTVGDFCHQGLCVAGPTVDCSYLDSSCQYGECQDGTCVTIITGPECEPDYCAGGCTVPFQWWSLHNSKCKSRSKRFRWPDDLENARLCGQTYYRWSQRRARNAWRMLMHQWLATTLNEANGACVPPEIVTAAGDAFNLLSQCDMTINITGVPGRPYRQLASTLYSYNTGTKGPGTCLRPSCAGQTSSSYFSCLFPQLQSRDLVDEEDISQLDCTHGLWDYVSDVCDCELGWTGPTCGECGVPDNEEHTFLCVPSVGETSQYILRSIPDEEIYLYINDDTTQLRQMMQLTDSMARYPGDGVLDCACNLIEAAIEERSTSVVVYGDISIYVTEIERNLQDCEQVFDVIIYNNNLDCDPNSTTTIIIEDEDSNCSQPENWNYICDCCLEDDEECACPNNDILCLRNHLIRNHQRKELYELLTVIFISVAAFLFLLLVGYYVRRNRMQQPEMKETESVSIFLDASRQNSIMSKFGRAKKKRNYE